MVCAPTFAKCAGHERPKASPEGEKAAAHMEAREDRQLVRNLVHWTSPPHPRVAKARTRREEEDPNPSSPFWRRTGRKGSGGVGWVRRTRRQLSPGCVRGMLSSMLSSVKHIPRDAENRRDGDSP